MTINSIQKIPALLFFILFSPFVLSQNNWTELQRIETEADRFIVDNLSNIYTLSANTLCKYSANSDYKSKICFSETELGKISHVNADNPHNIVLFYNEFQAVRFLDNKLTPKSNSEYYLSHYEIEEATAVCTSKEGGIWVFDNISKQLIHLNSDFEKTKESQAFDLLFECDYNPVYMLEHGNSLYVNTLENTLLRFDNYGNFDTHYPLSIDYDFCVSKTINYYNKQEKALYKYYPKLFETGKIELNGHRNVINAKFLQNKLYLLLPKAIIISRR